MSSGCVYTIGHGGQTTSDLLEKLQRRKIQFIIDVRSTPYSRYQPEFSREKLAPFLKENNIKYVFMGDLLGGKPEDKSCYCTNGKVDYDKCRTKKFFKDGIKRVCDACSQRLRICLLCSEGKPWQCHRSKLVGEVLKKEHGIEVLHIRTDSEEDYTQEQAIEKLTGDQQPSLFAEIAPKEILQSRKSYQSKEAMTGT